MTTSIIEIYDPKTLEIKTTATIHGSIKDVMDFIKKTRDIFFPGCLIKEIDPEDTQMDLLK